MSIFDSLSYKNSLIPGCRIDENSSTQERVVMFCDVKKVLGDTTITTERPLKIVIEGGKMYPLDSGDLPEPAIRETISFIQRTLRPK
jgi:hypothetical protein